MFIYYKPNTEISTHANKNYKDNRLKRYQR